MEKLRCTELIIYLFQILSFSISLINLTFINYSSANLIIEIFYFDFTLQKPLYVGFEHASSIWVLT